MTSITQTAINGSEKFRILLPVDNASVMIVQDADPFSYYQVCEMDEKINVLSRRD
jgi:hypothetical protein